MFLVKSLNQKNYNVSFCVLKVIRTYSVPSSCPIAENDYQRNNETHDKSKMHPNVVYNSVLAKRYGKNPRYTMWRERLQNEKMLFLNATEQPLPVTLKYLTEDTNSKTTELESHQTEAEKVTHFPFAQNYNFYSINTPQNEKIELKESLTGDAAKEEIQKRYMVMKNTDDWMTAYDNFENDLLDDENDRELNRWTINYGTPDPKSKTSNVPCGGCGALLHCKDTSIPGYIPSEIFNNTYKPGSSSLEAIVCQRCYFLKEHNLALQVQVSPSDYPKILQRVLSRQTLVVLIVDLTDFPCSIWPGISDILGPKTPIILVGNKIDLLPRDCRRFLKNVECRLLDELKLNGFGSSNILDVKLISAKTGFGVENLITSLHTNWKYKGDVYLVGCTNVGKSSLFNTLLQSDYCKVRAADLVQRATISRWPGTTLNLLKFPILRPSRYRLFLRCQRLRIHQKTIADQERIRQSVVRNSNDIQLATLMSHIGRTFVNSNKEQVEVKDYFSVQGSPNSLGKLKMGVSEKDPHYALSKWCYDTPGVVQSDQILNILTINELMYTIPKELIVPETFCIKPGMTLYIAGLARFDYIEGPSSVRITVFRSNELPLTICSLEKADEVYKMHLGTEYFKVPIADGDRISKWPGLHPGDILSVTGIHSKQSSKDIVLSSAGWVAVNCRCDHTYKFQAWTPEKRGIYLRDCLLPYAVTLRGPRISGTITYRGHKFL